MVNKYTATGLALEAATESKRIIVVVPRQIEVREALNIFMATELVKEAHKQVRRANGSERIDFHTGGSILFKSAGQDIRGFWADVVYVEEDVVRHWFTDDQWEKFRLSALALLSSRGGELIIGG